MITKTASEIIEAAKWLGQVGSSDFSTFEIATGLLNDEYLQLYKEISETGNFYTKYVYFNGNICELPSDCYRVLGVYKVVNEAKYALTPSASKQFIDGTYKIENNAVQIIGTIWNSQKFCVKYSVIPQTLTAPDKDVDTGLTKGSATYTWNAMTDDGVYYVVNGVAKYLDFGTMASEDKVQVAASDYFMGGHLTFSAGKILFNGNDVTDEIFPNMPTGLTIDSIAVSDPYCFVNLSDGHIAIVEYDPGSDVWGTTEWIHLEARGKTTLGKIVAAWTNSKTGRGVIYYNQYDDKYYYASFVPDTVLSYPNQEFYSLLEYRLGALLASMIGLPVSYLSEVLIPRAEQQFYDTLRKDSYQATRINKQSRGITRC